VQVPLEYMLQYVCTPEFDANSYICFKKVLHTHGVDFIVSEFNSEIGGRVKHAPFGKRPDGKPYIVELGANWVQGLQWPTGKPVGPENPIWTAVKNVGLNNTYSDYSSMLTYNEAGFTDFYDLLVEYETAYVRMEQDAGRLLVENIQDRSARTGFSLANWKPRLYTRAAAAEAVEWFEWDFEYAHSPEESSQLFNVANHNSTFYQFGGNNNYVWDQRGFSAFLIDEARGFLKTNDSRLLLETIVSNVTYSDHGVTVHHKDGSCIEADYAICTFSLGVRATTHNLIFSLQTNNGILSGLAERRCLIQPVLSVVEANCCGKLPNWHLYKDISSIQRHFLAQKQAIFPLRITYNQRLLSSLAVALNKRLSARV
jgi:hypothetical protein